MSYTTPVKDRTKSDITNRTSKAFINLADRTRIYNNSRLANGLAVASLGTPILFTILLSPDPTTTSFPTVTEWNTILSNIETLRLAVADESITGTTTEIKDDYIAGAGYVSPDYADANLWESTVDAIWDHWNGDSLDVCPTLNADLTILTGTSHIVVDCIDLNGYTIDIQGTGALYIL